MGDIVTFCKQIFNLLSQLNIFVSPGQSKPLEQQSIGRVVFQSEEDDHQDQGILHVHREPQLSGVDRQDSQAAELPGSLDRSVVADVNVWNFLLFSILVQIDPIVIVH